MKHFPASILFRRAGRSVKVGLVAALIIIGAVVAPAVRAAGGALSLTTSAITVPVGGTFAIRVNASSNGTATNTIAADVTFPANLVQGVAVSGPSVITIAITKNVIGDGLASIQGGIIPALVLKDSPIGTVTFKALKEGVATFALAASSDIYAADGHGTKLAPALGSVKVTIGPAAPTAPAPIPTPAPTPAPVAPTPICNPAPATTPTPATPAAVNPAPVCPQTPAILTWWQNNRDLVAVAGATALVALGLYFIIRSLIIFRKKRKHKH